jgi:ribosomal protein L32
MCFRPTEIEMNKCPKCGKANKPIDKVCAECGEPLEIKKVDIENMSVQGAGSAPVVPKAPGTPKAPGAPSAPKPPPN